MITILMTPAELDSVFSALSSPVRRSIVTRLAQGGPAFVGDLQGLHDISLPATVVVKQDGTVHWVYVGDRPSDRPLLTDVLAVLDG